MESFRSLILFGLRILCNIIVIEVFGALYAGQAVPGYGTKGTHLRDERVRFAGRG